MLAEIQIELSGIQHGSKNLYEKMIF